MYSTIKFMRSEGNVEENRRLTFRNVYRMKKVILHISLASSSPLRFFTWKQISLLVSTNEQGWKN